jgi:hypothetical protein
MRRAWGGKRVAKIALVVGAALVLVGCQLELGPPGNTFGADPTSPDPQPAMWASINGPYSRHQDGDPYATKCATDTVTPATCDSGPGSNTSYDPNGYLWAIDVPGADVGHLVTVSIYDPAFDPGGTTDESYAGANVGFATSYQLFETTGDPANISTAPSNGMNAVGHCTGGTPGYQVFAPGTSSQNAWYALCTFVPDKAGIYPLQVKTSAIPGVTDAGSGINNFSIRATATGGLNPHPYALFSESLFTTDANGQIYLALVPPQYAGHTMVIDLYDPGDAAGTAAETMQFLAPPSGSPSVVPSGGTAVACDYSPPTVSQGGVTSNSSPTCTVPTKSVGSTGDTYNGMWLRVVLTIPADYSCTTDCWWTIRYAGVGNTLTDRLVAVVNLSA